MAERVLTGVSGSFAASHVCVEGRPHCHRWEVMAWFELPGRQDAQCQRAALDMLLGEWDGEQLPPNLDWGEDIARAIGTLVGCVEVIVSRPDERIYARWVA